MTSLYWLPQDSRWRSRLQAFAEAPAAGWEDAVGLARFRLDFARTNALDGAVRQRFTYGLDGASVPRVRLALLGSSTMSHLHAAIRVAGMRRGIWFEIYENAFGQYRQELQSRDSPLHSFKPDVVLLAFDAEYLAMRVNSGSSAAEVGAAISAVSDEARWCWRTAREAFGCRAIHQIPVPSPPALLGENERRLPGSAQSFLARVAEGVRDMAEQEGVDVVSLDAHALRDGIAAWHDPLYWAHAKQAVAPSAAPMYGELVARVVAAQMSRSAKCLVLDLDNTLWGEEVGEVGVAGIVLGQGSAQGEIYRGFQAYVRELSRRGVILSVCSKNDAANALAPFERHPEMVLKRDEIAAFVANWSPKPDNLRALAETLSIGLDSLVFIDDSAFERDLVRRELPMVSVPEMPDDPARFAQTIADAGYFEAVALTEEDGARVKAYRDNQLRETARASASNLTAYLDDLQMELMCSRFDAVALKRIAQLINKTNQFNLTTRRHDERAIAAFMDDTSVLPLQFRLSDRFGDNGVIGVIIGRMVDDECVIDTWLMSCRVLGREVERAMMNAIALIARDAGARRLVGEYVASDRNSMVRDHYARLGFAAIEGDTTRSTLDLERFEPLPTPISLSTAQT